MMAIQVTTGHGCIGSSLFKNICKRSTFTSQQRSQRGYCNEHLCAQSYSQVQATLSSLLLGAAIIPPQQSADLTELSSQQLLLKRQKKRPNTIFCCCAANSLELKASVQIAKSCSVHICRVSLNTVQ